MKMNVYLSGGMEYAKNHGADWRAKIEKWLNKELRHGAFNPVRESDRFLTSKFPKVDFRKIKFTDINKHRQIASEIVRFDCSQIILKSDYVICYYDKSAQDGAGTNGELTVAKLFGKPVYLIAGIKREEIPSWALGCADRIFDDFDSLKNFLRTKFSHQSSR
jgi:hypothetical protein